MSAGQKEAHHQNKRSTRFIDAETRADITVPIYYVKYRGEVVHVESKAFNAHARLPVNAAAEGWTIDVRVENKSWVAWPPEKATQPKEDEE